VRHRGGHNVKLRWSVRFVISLAAAAAGGGGQIDSIGSLVDAAP